MFAAIYVIGTRLLIVIDCSMPLEEQEDCFIGEFTQQDCLYFGCCYSPEIRVNILGRSNRVVREAKCYRPVQGKQ